MALFHSQKRSHTINVHREGFYVNNKCLDQSAHNVDKITVEVKRFILASMGTQCWNNTHFLPNELYKKFSWKNEVDFRFQLENNASR